MNKENSSFDKEKSEEELQRQIDLIPEPPVIGKRWPEMTEQEQQALRDYYDNTDLSALMEKEGEWIYPSIEKGLEQAARGEVKELDFDDVQHPYQLEFDLGLVPIPWDENKRYSLIDMRLVYDRELSTSEYNELCDAVLDALDEHFPCEFASATIRSGTDKELFPEAYDEGEELNRIEKEEM